MEREELQKINRIILERIEMKRIEKGLSKTELYQLSKTTGSAFSQWRSGATSPTNNTLSNIANCLDTTVDYLRLGVDTKKAATPEGSGISDKDIKLLEWFRSLSPEKQKAILYDADAPEGLV